MTRAPRLKDISHIDFPRKSDFSQETPFRVLKHGGGILLQSKTSLRPSLLEQWKIPHYNYFPFDEICFRM